MANESEKDERAPGLRDLGAIDELLPLALEVSANEQGEDADQMRARIAEFLVNDRAVESLEEILSRENLPDEMRSAMTELFAAWQSNAKANSD